jgi:hypothetical protein
MYFYNKSSATLVSSIDVPDDTSKNRTVQLNTEVSTTSNIYNGWVISIESGLGTGQTRVIKDYDGITKIATLTEDWTTIPTNTGLSKYQLRETVSVIDQGKDYIDLSNSTDTQLISNNQLLVDSYNATIQTITSSTYLFNVSPKIIETVGALYSGGTAITLEDNALTGKDSDAYFVDWYIKVKTGGAVGQEQKIIGYDATSKVATLSLNFSSSVETYFLMEVGEAIEIESAVTGTINSVTLSIADDGTNAIAVAGKQYSGDGGNFFADEGVGGAGWYVIMLSGNASGDRRQISGYTFSTRVATVSPNWSSAVQASDTYRLSKLYDIPGGGINTVQLQVDGGNELITNYYKNWYIKMTSGAAVGEIKRIISYNTTNRIATVETDWITQPVAIFDEYILMDSMRKYISLNQSNPEYYGIYTTSETDSNVIPFNVKAGGTNTSKILPVDVSSDLVSTTNQAVRLRVGNTLTNSGGLVLEGYDSTGTGTTKNLMTLNTDGILHLTDAIALPNNITATRPDGSIQAIDGKSGIEVYASATWNRLTTAMILGHINGLMLYFDTAISVYVSTGEVEVNGILLEKTSVTAVSITGVTGEDIVYIYMGGDGTITHDINEPTYSNFGWYYSGKRMIGCLQIDENNVIANFRSHGFGTTISYHVQRNSSAYSNINGITTATPNDTNVSIIPYVPTSVVKTVFYAECTVSTAGASDHTLYIADKNDTAFTTGIQIKYNYSIPGTLKTYGFVYVDRVTRQINYDFNNFATLATTLSAITILIPGFDYTR